MKLFVDTGNLKDIEALAAIGILDGVTTNPSLMAKEGGDPRQILKQICQLVQGPVSGEVVSTDAQGMVDSFSSRRSISFHSLRRLWSSTTAVACFSSFRAQPSRMAAQSRVISESRVSMVLSDCCV